MFIKCRSRYVCFIWRLIWYAFVRRVGASDNKTKRQTARCRAVDLLSCLKRGTPNGALSCGVLSQCHIVARFKLTDRRAALETGRQDNSATTRHLELCRVVASDRTTRRKFDNAPFRALSGFVASVAVSRCHLAYKPILRFEPSDNMTSRQHAARQRAVWRTSLSTGRQDKSPTTRRFALYPVVASANRTHKSVPN
jgi:hypothetical protein